VWKSGEVSDFVQGLGFESIDVGGRGLVVGQEASGAQDGPCTAEGGLTENEGSIRRDEIMTGNAEGPMIRDVGGGTGSIDERVDETVRAAGSGVGRERRDGRTERRIDGDGSPELVTETVRELLQYTRRNGFVADGDEANRQRAGHSWIP
jgi:hypothetical protein